MTQTHEVIRPHHQADQEPKGPLGIFFEEHSYSVHLFYFIAVLFILYGLWVDPLDEIWLGLKRIIVSPSNLITDYFELGGVGATFINAGLLLLANAFVIGRHARMITGPIVSALLIVTGFAFFGKNIFNSIPFGIGVWLYSRFMYQQYASVMLTGLYATTLAPIVSIISFGQEAATWLMIPLGFALGIFLGFVIPPIASRFMRFHQGYSLYNMGFTAGVIGMIATSILRVFKVPVTYDMVDYYIEPTSVRGFFIALCVLLVIIGGLQGGFSWTKYRQLMQETGQLVSDFVTDYGPDLALINMGVMGLLIIAYVHLTGGQLNGAVTGGLLTVIGFSGFGKHPRNVLPVILGVYVMQSLMFVDDPGSTSGLLVAIFGTTLAPIAGHYGLFPGFIAGLLHATVAPHTGVVYAGLNLYNNGFAAAFVAASLVPLFDTWQEHRQLVKMNRGGQ